MSFAGTEGRLRTELSREECARRIEAEFPRDALVPRAFAGSGVAATPTRAGFRLRALRPFGRQAYAPLLFVALTPVEGATEVTLTRRMSRFSQAFLAVWLLGIATLDALAVADLVGALGRVDGKTQAIFSQNLAAVLAMSGFFLLIAAFGVASGRWYARPLLDAATKRLRVRLELSDAAPAPPASSP